MPRYRIHSPWLEGQESNGIKLLPSAIEKMRAGAIDELVMTGDSISDGNRVSLRNVVGKIQQLGDDLILVTEYETFFAPPGKSNKIVDYVVAFCIQIEEDCGAENHDVLRDGFPYGTFISIDSAYLVDREKCAGCLELIWENNIKCL